MGSANAKIDFIPANDTSLMKEKSLKMILYLVFLIFKALTLYLLNSFFRRFSGHSLR